LRTGCGGWAQGAPRGLRPRSNPSSSAMILNLPMRLPAHFFV